jgi:hypothetical protein
MAAALRFAVVKVFAAFLVAAALRPAAREIGVAFFGALLAAFLALAALLTVFFEFLTVFCEVFFAGVLAPRLRSGPPWARRRVATFREADFFLAFFADVFRAMTWFLRGCPCFALFRSAWLP